MANFQHTPVLLEEVLTALRPRAGGRYLDGTVGGGGHAAAILRASSPDGYLVGCDQDEMAIAAARERLLGEGFVENGTPVAARPGPPQPPRFELHRVNFADVASVTQPGSFDGALLDLGVSSPQLDLPERGFSFQAEGPLDMRQDQRQPVTAASIVNGWSAEELARIFFELGGERDSRRLARAIVRAREQRRIETTRQLAELIERESPRAGRKAHPATKIFMALRMEVNQELPKLAAGLEACWGALRPGGALAVITFHSLEDRMVKDFGRKLARDYDVPGGVDRPDLRVPKAPEGRLPQRKAILPSERELAENPRSRSAQLRVIEKL